MGEKILEKIRRYYEQKKAVIVTIGDGSDKPPAKIREYQTRASGGIVLDYRFIDPDMPENEFIPYEHIEDMQFVGNDVLPIDELEDRVNMLEAYANKPTLPEEEDYIDERIKRAHREGAILTIRYRKGDGEETVSGTVAPLDSQGFQVSNINEEFPIPYCTVRNISEECLPDSQEEKRVYPFPELVGKCSFVKRHCHMIAGYWCSHKECEDYVLVKKAEDADDGAENTESDIAKLRWEWVGNELKGHCGATIAISINPGVGDRAKIAAAPDMLELLEEMANKINSTHYMSGGAVAIPAPEELALQINVIIKKVRGGE